MPTWPPSYASNRPPGHVAFVDRLLDLPRLGRVADELELERGRPPPELAKKAGFRPTAAGRHHVDDVRNRVLTAADDVAHDDAGLAQRHHIGVGKERHARLEQPFIKDAPSHGLDAQAWRP